MVIGLIRSTNTDCDQLNIKGESKIMMEQEESDEYHNCYILIVVDDKKLNSEYSAKGNDNDVAGEISSDDLFSRNSKEDGFSSDGDSTKQISEISEAENTNLTRKGHICLICGKSYTSRYSLKIHNNQHTGLKQFQCKICNKSFASSGILKKHVVIHNRNNQCEICNRFFLRKESLKKHVETHFGEDPYHCAVCNKSFTNSENLLGHICIFSPKSSYKCNCCENVFPCQRDLDQHISQCSDRLYKCKVCEKSFNGKDSFVKHMHIHSTDRKYMCEKCNKYFTRSSDLKRHMNTKVHLLQID